MKITFFFPLIHAFTCTVYTHVYMYMHTTGEYYCNQQCHLALSSTGVCTCIHVLSHQYITSPQVNHFCGAISTRIISVTYTLESCYIVNSNGANTMVVYRTIGNLKIGAIIRIYQIQPLQQLINHGLNSDESLYFTHIFNTSNTQPRVKYFTAIINTYRRKKTVQSRKRPKDRLSCPLYCHTMRSIAVGYTAGASRYTLASDTLSTGDSELDEHTACGMVIGDIVDSGMLGQLGLGVDSSS